MVGKDSIQFSLKLLLFLVPVFVLAGCKMLQKVNIGTNENKSVAMLVEKAQLAEPRFRTLEIKKMNVKVNLSNQNEYNSPANCKIITDSVIHISVQPFFGIEMFVVRFTPDTFIFIDKTKNTCYQSDYAFLNTKYNLDLSFATIQAIFTNKLFVAGENRVQSAMFKNIQEKNTSSGFEYENEKYTGRVLLNPNFRISDMEVNVKSGPEKFHVSYTGFGETGQAASFPYAIGIKLSNDLRESGISMNILKLITEEEITLPELNIYKYQKGNISTLLK